MTDWRKELDDTYSYLYTHGYTAGPVKRLLGYARNSLMNCDRILDAGCGLCAFEQQMALHGYTGQIRGIDVSKAVTLRAPTWCHARHGSLDKMKYRDGEFDGLFCCDVLEHIPPTHIDTVIKELRRVLHPAGNFAISISCKSSFFRDKSKGDLHLTIQKPEWWKEKLTAFGFNYVAAINESNERTVSLWG